MAGRINPIECATEGCHNMIARYAILCPECLTETPASEFTTTEVDGDQDDE